MSSFSTSPAVRSFANRQIQNKNNPSVSRTTSTSEVRESVATGDNYNVVRGPSIPKETFLEENEPSTPPTISGSGADTPLAVYQQPPGSATYYDIDEGFTPANGPPQRYYSDQQSAMQRPRPIARDLPSYSSSPAVNSFGNRQSHAAGSEKPIARDLPVDSSSSTFSSPALNSFGQRQSHAAGAVKPIARDLPVDSTSSPAVNSFGTRPVGGGGGGAMNKPIPRDLPSYSSSPAVDSFAKNREKGPNPSGYSLQQEFGEGFRVRSKPRDMDID